VHDKVTEVFRTPARPYLDRKPVENTSPCTINPGKTVVGGTPDTISHGDQFSRCANTSFHIVSAHWYTIKEVATTGLSEETRSEGLLLVDGETTQPKKRNHSL
jgi:hypothetical protein